MRNWTSEIKAAMGGMNASNDYDISWLKQMIEHHKMAVKMSQQALSKATHQELKDLAKAIISAQSAEITKMQIWIDQWSKEK